MTSQGTPVDQDEAADPTLAVLDDVRDRFGEDFVPARVAAEREAAVLLDARAGELTRDEAMELGRLFNRHSKAGQLRKDRFSPAFAGATMQKVTEDIDRFNEVVVGLWKAPIEDALTLLGEIYADRSLLPGAGSSLPSMLLYLRDPEKYAVCINATMRGLAHAVGEPPIRADGRAGYEAFSAAVLAWRERYEIAPQETDAVLTTVMRENRETQGRASREFVFGAAPSRFLTDLAANNNGAWMEENRDRYRNELRKPFAELLERIAEGHLRELDPLLDTTIKANRVLAGIRRRFADESGEYYAYLWGAFSRARKQEDVQLAVLVAPDGLQASLFLGSASPEHRERLRRAIERDATLIEPLLARTLIWDVGQGDGYRAQAESSPVKDAADAVAWLDAGGTAITWSLGVDAPELADPRLPDRIGALFRVLHPLAAAAWGDEPPAVSPTEPDGSDDEDDRPTLEQVAQACHLPVEDVEEWVTSLGGRMRQAFFYGPPGTGKTFVANRLARHLATSAEHIRVVQFHAAYSYEDFIEGLRPDLDGKQGTLTYSVQPGVFQEFCSRARLAKDDTFVLVIDEMNRADLAAVFGELLLLLEYRGDTTVVLPYSKRPFSVPRNVIVLATMNTADRSLALVDFALRRRFHAIPLDPSRDVLAGWLKARPGLDPELPLSLFSLVRERVGADTPVAPGHSYWMEDDLDAAAVERIWTFQVKPYLAEHWFEEPDELARLDQEVRALIAEHS